MYEWFKQLYIINTRKKDERMEARYNNPNAYPDDQEIGEVVDLLNGKIDSKEQDMTL